MWCEELRSSPFLLKPGYSPMIWREIVLLFRQTKRMNAQHRCLKLCFSALTLLLICSSEQFVEAQQRPAMSQQDETRFPNETSDGGAAKELTAVESLMIASLEDTGARLLAVSANGNYAAFGEKGQYFRIVDLRTRKTIQKLVGHGLKGGQWAVFSKDNRHLYTLVWSGMHEIHGSNKSNSEEWFDKFPPALRRPLYQQEEQGDKLCETSIMKWDLVTGENVATLESAEGETFASMDYSATRNEVAVVLIKDVPNRGWEDRETQYSVAIFDLDNFRKLGQYRFPIPLENMSDERPGAVFVDEGKKVVAFNRDHLFCCDLSTGRIEWSAGHVIDASTDKWCMSSGPIAVASYGNAVWLVSRQEVDDLEQQESDPEGNYHQLWYQVQGIDVSLRKRIALFDLPKRTILGNADMLRAAEWYHVHSTVPKTLLFSLGNSIYVAPPVDRSGNTQLFKIDSARRTIASISSRESHSATTDRHVHGSRGVVSNPGTKHSSENAQIASPNDQQLLSPGQQRLEGAVPVEISLDGSRVLFESSTELVLWNVEESVAAGAISKSEFRETSGISNQFARGIRSVATISSDDSKVYLAVPYHHEYTETEFIKRHGPTTSPGHPDARQSTAEALAEFTDVGRRALVTQFGLRWLGPEWGLYEWNPQSGRVTQMGALIRSPGMDVRFVEEGDWIVCAFLERDEGKTVCKLRVVSANDFKTKEVVLIEESGNATSLGAFRGDDLLEFCLHQMQASVPQVEILRCSKKDATIAFSDNGLDMRSDIVHFVFKNRRITTSRFGDDSVLDRLISSTGHIRLPHAIDRTRSELIRLEMDWDRSIRMPGDTSSFGQQPTSNGVLNLYSLTDERLIRRIPIPDSLIDSQSLQLPPVFNSNGNEQNPARLLALLSIRFSPSGSLVALSLRGKPFLNAIMDIKTGQIVSQFNGTSPAMFLRSDRFVLSGTTVRDVHSNQVVGSIEILRLKKDDNLVLAKKSTATVGLKRTDSWLYFLGLGVDQYQSPQIAPLENCQNDVTSLETSLRNHIAQSYGRFVPQRLPEKSTVLDVENRLSSLDVVRPEDDVVLIFSGHGKVGNRGLYLLTSESDLNTLQGTAVNWQTIAAKIDDLKAKKIIVLLDACHSGGFAESNSAIQKELAERLKKKNGLLLIASSGGNETSQELENNGAFTIALTEAIQGQADANRDKQTTVAELLVYVENRVVDLSHGAQHPQVIVQNITGSELAFASSVGAPE